MDAPQTVPIRPVDLDAAARRLRLRIVEVRDDATATVDTGLGGLTMVDIPRLAERLGIDLERRPGRAVRD